MVRAASVDATYTLSPLGEWYTTRLHLAGTLVILFVRRGFSMDMTFGDHWRTAPDAVIRGSSPASGSTE